MTPDKLEYWVAALSQNLRWKPLSEFHFYPERMESEVIEDYLARYERHHRKSVDAHSLSWFAGNKTPPENRNEHALLVERFRFALTVLKVQQIVSRHNSMDTLLSWALIGAWRECGAEYFVRETSNSIRAMLSGGRGDELIDEWLRMGA